jgi:hypothetical protein
MGSGVKLGSGEAQPPHLPQSFLATGLCPRRTGPDPMDLACNGQILRRGADCQPPTVRREMPHRVSTL